MGFSGTMASNVLALVLTHGSGGATGFVLEKRGTKANTPFVCVRVGTRAIEAQG